MTDQLTAKVSRMGLMLPVEHGAEDYLPDRLENLLDVVRVARDGGLDFLDAPQHYLAAPSQYLHCVPLLARVAAESGDLALGTNIIQLTLHNPVEVAEQLATLDHICGGRLTAGFGRGYREQEFTSFGVAPGTRLSRFLEALELVKRLWMEESVTFEGKHFHLEDARIGVRPRQSPRPPVVIAASADKMVERAAVIADGLSLAGHSTLEGLVPQAQIYRQAVEAAGTAFPPYIFRIMLEAYVAKSDDEAKAIAYPHIARKYKSYFGWGQDEVLPEGQTFAQEIDDLAKGRFVVGSPETVTRRLLEYRDQLGVNEIGVRMHWIGMPYELMKPSVELYCREVVPAVKGA